jgi:plasmid segregation protein ParM
VNIDGKDYCVGAGKTVTSPDKTDHEINKICTLYSMVQNGSDEYLLVVGLPIGQFKSQKDKFRNTILGYNSSKVYYHNAEMKLKISDVMVYPQGAAVIYTLNRMNGKYIILDVGAFTVDVALIEMVNGYPNVIKYDTWFKGITTLLSPIADAINNKFTLTLEPQDTEEVLINGFVKINGKSEDIFFTDNVMNSYLDGISELFDINYKSHTTDIYLCGGGAELLYPMFKLRYPHVEIIKDSQFANAKGFYQVGLQKYTKHLTESRC